MTSAVTAGGKEGIENAQSLPVLVPNNVQTAIKNLDSKSFHSNYKKEIEIKNILLVFRNPPL